MFLSAHVGGKEEGERKERRGGYRERRKYVRGKRRRRCSGGVGGWVTVRERGVNS